MRFHCARRDANGNPILDPDGNPDTSFLAKIPADIPFTFQTVDKDGLALNMSQTWHQVRPGEVRNNCGGCHAHSQTPTDFSQTAAAQSGYQLRDLFASSPMLTKDGNGEPALSERSERAVDVEYYRDIKPILERSCVGCHSGSGGTPAAQLVLDDTAIVNSYDNTYNRLARDSDADYGIKPVISNGKWRQTNASRYIRKFQSRRSLLIWKIFGRRLDGWNNEDHPTESVPGDPSTLPPGANANDADIDFTGTIMPPPGSHAQYPPLSEDEKITFARWVDLGCPVDTQNPAMKSYGWFGDDLRPTLTISLPRAGLNSAPLTQLRVGMLDYYSGLDVQTYSVTADFAVNGNAPGTELASLFAETGDHIWTLPLSSAISDLGEGTLTVSVKDVAGNITKMVRTFSVGNGGGGTPNPPVIDSFTATPATISVGDSSTLSWAIGQGEATLTELSITPDIGDVLGSSQVVVRPASTTTYTLSATNPDGVATAQVTVTIEDEPPVTPPSITLFAANPSEIASGESATLSWRLDEGSSPLTGLTIEPGVGNVLGRSEVTVAPAETTTYTLTATSPDGSDTERTTVSVVIDDNVPPVANIAATPEKGIAPLEVKFDASRSEDPDGTIVRYAWEFGNGETATGVSTAHTFRRPGRYVATLTVTDDYGATGTDRFEIVVTEEEPPIGGKLKMEVGRLSRVTQRWHKVRLRNRYESMVVVATVVLPSTKAAPVVPRIRGVGSNQFQIRLQSPDDRQVRGRYDVHYMVVEEGVYSESAHGLKMEAVRARSEKTAGTGSWVVEPRTFKNEYRQPVVFGQVMSFEDKRWSVFWASGGRPGEPPGADGFAAGKHVGEDQNAIREPETIGYVVVETGFAELTRELGMTGGLGPQTVVGTGDNPEGTLYPIAGLEMAQIGLLSSAGMRGGNGGWPVLLRPRPVTDARLRLAIDEDRLADDERSHIAEQVAFAAFGGVPLPTAGVLTPPDSASYVSPMNTRTFEQWRQWHFGEEEEAAPRSVTANADTDGDGSKDFLEFAFDTDPNDPTSHVTPYVRLDENGIGLEYAHPADRAQLRYIVEASRDLKSWSVAAGEAETIDEDDHGNRMRFRPESSQRLRYFRVRVDGP